MVNSINYAEFSQFGTGVCCEWGSRECIGSVELVSWYMMDIITVPVEAKTKSKYTWGKAV